MIRPEKKFLIIAGLTILVMLLLLLSYFYVQSSQKSTALMKLQEETEGIQEAFLQSYIEAEKNTDGDTLFGSVQEAAERNGMLSFAEAKAILKKLPNDYAGIAKRDDIYVLLFGESIQGQELWDSFFTDSQAGKRGSVIIGQFAADASPLYYYLEYDGHHFHMIQDFSRDCENPDSGYGEIYFQYLKVEQFENSDNTITEYAYLTDDANINYSQVIEYFSSTEEKSVPYPSVWQFYIRTIKEEQS